MIEEDSPGFDGVERVLGQNERAACGRRPCIDQRDLNKVDPIVEPREIAAGFVVDELHARIAIQVPGEIAESTVDQVDDAFVDFDAGHLLLIEGQRRQHVPTAACTDDDHA